MINNSKEPKQTDLYVKGTVIAHLDLEPIEMRWVDYKDK